MTTTLYVGGRIEVGGEARPAQGSPPPTALLVDGGVVGWVGAADAADGLRQQADDVVELAGALVTPAFVDAHVHSTSTGLTLGGLDLTGSRSLTEALDRVAHHVAAHPGAQVVLGHGWDETTWPERRPPSLAELDRACGDRAVYVTRIDVHSALASSALLAGTPGLAALDGYTAEGLLSRDAHHAARAAALASVGPTQRAAAQRATRRRCAAVGIGLLHELGGPDISSPDDLTGLLALADREPGPDVLAYWGELGGVERARELGALGAAGDLFADGALGSHTAALRTVYADEPHRGAAYLTAAQVRDHVVACTHAGLQAGFHVIGDGALDTVIAGLGEAAELVGVDALRARRHRLEHVEMPDSSHLAAMARLGVLASVQPVFDALWGGPEGMYVERVGSERAAGMNPFAAMEAAGVAIALGSDSPVTPLGPWEAVRAAVFHRTPGAGLGPRTAFLAHTMGGVQAAGPAHGAADPRLAGTLHPGAPASLAVWDHRPVGDALLPDLMPGLPVPACLRTVVRGRTVWTADETEGVAA